MESNKWVIPHTLNDCEIFFGQMVNRECGEFVIAFRQDNGLFGTAIYKSGLEYWFNGHYDLETDLDAHCDAMDRARHWVDNFLEKKRGKS